MIRAGMAPGVARMLLKAHGPEVCTRQIKYLPWRRHKNGAGLRRYIETDAGPPPTLAAHLRETERAALWERMNPEERRAAAAESGYNTPPGVRENGPTDERMRRAHWITHHATNERKPATSPAVETTTRQNGRTTSIE